MREERDLKEISVRKDRSETEREKSVIKEIKGRQLWQRGMVRRK